jgi:ABC-type branched-subunit amino acid transport system ATPase component
VTFGGHQLWGHRMVPSLLGTSAVRASERGLADLAARALSLVGMDDGTSALAGDLPSGLRRRVEIARALMTGPDLLLLDEPSSGMDAHETAELSQLVNALVDELGIAVFLVEHDMAMVRMTADHVYVLDRGSVLLSGPTADVLSDRRVAEAYLGRGVTSSA